MSHKTTWAFFSLLWSEYCILEAVVSGIHSLIYLGCRLISLLTFGGNNAAVWGFWPPFLSFCVSTGSDYHLTLWHAAKAKSFFQPTNATEHQLLVALNDILYLIFKFSISESRVMMAQWLGVLTALPKYLSSVSSTHIEWLRISHTWTPGDDSISSGTHS